MATQGIVSIRHNGEILFKVVAGSNGMNAPRLAALLKDLSPACTAGEVYELAAKARFGDPDTDLIVQGRDGTLCFDSGQIFDEDLGPLYRDAGKFADPKFNPRWDCGLAEYIEIVEINQSSDRHDS